MKEREYIAKHGGEKIGGVSAISKEAIELAKRDDSEIIDLIERKIKEAHKRLFIEGKKLNYSDGSNDPKP